MEEIEREKIRAEALEEAAQYLDDNMAGEQRYYLNVNGQRVDKSVLLAYNTGICNAGDEMARQIRRLKESRQHTEACHYVSLGFCNCKPKP